MQYENHISSGLQDRVKFFVHAADADGRAMTLASRTFLSRLAKNHEYINDI